MSLKHQDIWRAIDLLAESHGMTPSGLAKLSGLDPTSFNPSKRSTADGRLRWPSTETLAKIFQATGEGVDRLGDFLKGTIPPESTAFSQDNTQNYTHESKASPNSRIPLLGYAQAGQEGFFDEAGFPVGEGWDFISILPKSDPNLYALEVSGNSMQPLYRDGDVLIVSPLAQSIRRGDRVVVRTHKGEVMAKQLQRMTAQQIGLKSLNESFEDILLPREAVQWIARILWVSQ
jgi:phage repressor protein C with HTH and peptisase S24 domain